jgi:hypothetical protein
LVGGLLLLAPPRSSSAQSPPPLPLPPTVDSGPTLVAPPLAPLVPTPPTPVAEHASSSAADSTLAPPPAAAPTTEPAAPAPPPGPPSEPALREFFIPKALSLTAGWSYTPTNRLPISPTNTQLTPQGVNVDAALMWQVRGFGGDRWPAWIGFMAGFLYYVGGHGLADSVGLNYGIFVKHALFPGRRARFWAGYGLGAAQIWVRELDGHGAGHYTRLSLGADTQLWRRLHLTVEFSYRFFILPTFATSSAPPTSYDFHALSLLAGFWLGR